MFLLKLSIFHFSNISHCWNSYEHEEGKKREVEKSNKEKRFKKQKKPSHKCASILLNSNYYNYLYKLSISLKYKENMNARKNTRMKYKERKNVEE